MVQKMCMEISHRRYKPVVQMRDTTQSQHANREHNTINSISLDKSIAEVIGTKKWTPLSIHSSKMNGNLLVGMSKDGEGKVTRYKTFKEREDI